MSMHESWVEKQIREATERGEFDNLPGSGKPLDLHDEGDPDWWVKRYLARENLDTSAAMPPVMQLRAERATYPNALVDIAREEQVREILTDYNRRVVADRLHPAVGRAMPVVAPLVDVDAMVHQWRTLRGQTAADDEADTATAPLPRPRRARWWRRRA